MRWRPYSVRIHGEESGHISEPLIFVRFWTLRSAYLWCQAMNNEDTLGLTRFVPCKLT